MPMLPLLLALAAADQVPPAPVLIDDNADRRRLIVLRPGAVTCGGITQEPVHRELPIPEARSVYSRQPAHPLTLAFSIDARGRAIDIHEISLREPSWAEAGDAAASLAAWQFASGAVRTRCRVSYSVDALTAAEVPLHDAYYAFAMRRGNSRAMRPFYLRTIPGSSDCFHPFPMFRLRGFPPYEVLERRPGSVSWTMIGFDIDAKGRTRNVRVIGSNHNAALDDTSADAVRASRFAPEAHHACALPFRLFSKEPLLPPTAEPTLDYRAPDAQCDGLPGKWASMPPLTFPDPFRRRSIEGWAIVRFDVAPWGETGNVEVVAAQPADAFGEAARRIIQRAKKPPSPRGFSGCVQRVNFKMRGRGSSAEPREEEIWRTPEPVRGDGQFLAG